MTGPKKAAAHKNRAKTLQSEECNCARLFVWIVTFITFILHCEGFVGFFARFVAYCGFESGKNALTDTHTHTHT